MENVSVALFMLTVVTEGRRGRCVFSREIIGTCLWRDADFHFPGNKFARGWWDPHFPFKEEKYP